MHGGRRSDRGRVASAWVFSVIGHLVALGLSGIVVAKSLAPRPSPVSSPISAPAASEDLVPIELPVVGALAAPGTPNAVDTTPIAPPRGGGEAIPRLDNGRLGRGGTDTEADPAINLADRDDLRLLSPEIQSRFDRSQIQRVRSSEHRSSREDMRSSREPMELTFVAEGQGDRHERRPFSPFDPSAGRRAHGVPSRIGSAVGGERADLGGNEVPRPVGGAIAGAQTVSLGSGVQDRLPGEDHRESAAAQHARPLVTEGSVQVPANRRGKPSDTVDCEQEVATMVQSIIHASNAGGVQGPGAGGQTGLGPAGAGGTAGPGSTAHPLGTGNGPGLDNDPLDRRRTDYMRRVLGRIYPRTANAMPTWALYEGLQGVVIVSFTIRGDGSVAGASITRPSGIPELDENCRRAVVEAAPFPPLPKELGTSFRWAMPFDFRNPAVRPRTRQSDADAP